MKIVAQSIIERSFALRIFPLKRSKKRLLRMSTNKRSSTIDKKKSVNRSRVNMPALMVPKGEMSMKRT